MNAAVITKIEYKFIGYLSFNTIPIIPSSGKFKEESIRSSKGLIYTTTVDLSISKIDKENDELIKSINNRKSQFRLTDANGTIIIVGDEEFPARLTPESGIDGTPGSFGGYRCKITCESQTGSKIQ